MTTAVLRRAVMKPLRDWLATQSTAAGTRIYVGSLPKTPTYPAAVIGRTGNGAPIELLDSLLVQIDAWAATGAAAEALAAEIQQTLEQAKPGTRLGAVSDGVQLMGAEALSLLDLPDPDTNQPRYVLTIDLAVKAVEVP